MPAVAVNLAARQLGDPSLVRTVADALERCDAPPGSLWLEVTETGAVADPGPETLRELHRLGVRLGIDDFGTGWASLERLATVPWDLVKIDRSFVATLESGDDQSRHVVRAMINMARTLDIATVAEGVETTHQLEQLAELGCDIAQGYVFSPAVPAEAAPRYLSADGHWDGPPWSTAATATAPPG